MDKISRRYDEEIVFINKTLYRAWKNPTILWTPAQSPNKSDANY